MELNDLIFGMNRTERERAILKHEYGTECKRLILGDEGSGTEGLNFQGNGTERTLSFPNVA